jgi:hypothetical protein
VEETRRRGGECGLSTARMPSNGAWTGFYRRGERRAYTRGAHLRQPMFRRDGSLRRYAKLPPVQLFSARGEETGKWRRRSVDGVTHSGPRGETGAQPTPPLAFRGQGLDRVRRIKTCVAPNEKKNTLTCVTGRDFSRRCPQMAFGGL